MHQTLCRKQLSDKPA